MSIEIAFPRPLKPSLCLLYCLRSAKVGLGRGAAPWRLRMPTSFEVYDSVKVMTERPVLAFFRNLHNWSSEVFMWLMVLHAARTISTRTFLGKRKFIWLSGAIVAVTGWVAFLSGSFMRGDQEALEGFAHMMYSFTPQGPSS